MIDGDRVVHEVRYPYPVERVWCALTDPAELAVWLMPNDFAPVAGRRFRLDARPMFDVLDCEVLEVDAPHRLRCRWTVEGTESVVTIVLHRDGPDGAATRLHLEHVRLPPERRDGFDGGWDAKLHRDLPLVLAGTRVPADAIADADALTRHPDVEV